MLQAKTLWIRNVVDRLMSVPGRRPGALGAYGLAMVCVAMAAVLPPPFGRLEHDLFLFSALYVGILFASFWGGARAGIFAALLGGLFAWGAFAGSQFIGVMIYIVVSIITVVAADHQRRLIAAFEAEAELRKLLIHELDHRLKNKIASIQAIISYQLQDQQEVLHRVVRRLAALSSADALVEAGQGRGAYIGDIATAELAPYGEARLSIDGPEIFVPTELALVLGLMLHELATNSAKYGAILHASGHLSLTWSLVGTTLSIKWRESGGPTVSEPGAAGFGSRLLLQASKMFGGSVELDFAPTGLICRLSLPLPSRDGKASGAISSERKRAPLDVRDVAPRTILLNRSWL